MAIENGQPGVGPLLREWRQRRRLTQLDVALDAGISARHLSFVETGRSAPSAEVVLRLADQLDVPFRERNQLLVAAGHAPAFPERRLSDPELQPVRAALGRILDAHDPYPAIVFDRRWNLVSVNAAMASLAGMIEADPALLEPPVNVLRLGLHPQGFAPLIVNFGEWYAHFRERLARQVAVTGDGDLAALLDEIDGYPAPDAGRDPRSGDPLGPVRVRAPDGRELAFFGMFATFDTPFEVTTSELAMELLFPADRRTADAFRRPDSLTREE